MSIKTVTIINVGRIKELLVRAGIVISMRRRAGGLYIQDNKLLLISEGDKTMFWTPGGGLEGSETFEVALERELLEELNARLISADLYLTYMDHEVDELVQYYLIDMELPDTIPNGTRIYAYSIKDHKANELPVSKRVYELVFPKLILDKLV